MKLNWSIFTKTLLTASCLASATASANAEAVELHLDSLDADGHLSILEAEGEGAKSHAQNVLAEPIKVALADTHQKDHHAKSDLKATVDTHKENHGTKGYTQAAVAAVPPVVDAHAENHGTKNYTQLVAAAPAADSHGGGHEKGHSKTSKGFLSKHTTEIEFTFAIIVIVIGLIASERFQRAQDQQILATEQAEPESSVRIAEKSEHQDVSRVG